MADEVEGVGDVTLPEAPIEAALSTGSVTAMMNELSESVEDLDELESVDSLPTVPVGHTRHELLGRLGVGGAATVELARDLDLGRRVALKRLHAEAARNPFILRHFIHEAQITAQLDHPHVVSIYAMESTQGETPSYTMKLVEGRNVRKLIKACRKARDAAKPLTGELSLATRLEHFLKVCDAIAYAHSKGVIHRDLKPENIMIGRFNQVYVVDWGIARLMGGEGDEALALAAEGDEQVQVFIDEDGEEVARTMAGAVVGSVPYMSPEQARGEHDKLDGRSDLYALGVILYELVQLKKAVQGQTLHETLTRAQEGQLEPMDLTVAGFGRMPPGLRAIIERATRTQASERYEGVAALAADVRAWLRGDAVSALDESRSQRVIRWMGRHKETTAAAFLALLLLTTAALAGAMIWSLNSQRRVALTQQASAEAEAQAAVRAKRRELGLSHLLSEVAAGGGRIDAHLLRVEGALSTLASAATHALVHGRPSREKLYGALHYERPGLAPRDFAPSGHYHRPVSIEQAVFKLAPGVTLRRVKPALQRLSPLRHLFRSLFVQSARLEAPPADGAATRQLLAEIGVPIIWAFVGLESGVMFAYPGKGGYPASYDPRKRPWYQLAARQEGVRWGNPYVDAMGAGLLLPSATSLYGPGGRFLGVAGVECTFDYIIENLMTLPGVQGIEATYLVDGEGDIVLGTDDHSKAFEAGELHQARALAKLPFPRAVAGIKAGEAGFHQLGEGGVIVARHRLLALPWWFVVVAESAVFH